MENRPEREAPSGVEYLRRIWGIPVGKPPREKPPAGVSTDIYTRPPLEAHIPSRGKPRAA